MIRGRIVVVSGVVSVDSVFSMFVGEVCLVVPKDSLRSALEAATQVSVSPEVLSVSSVREAMELGPAKSLSRSALAKRPWSLGCFFH
ncbi:hypothetical protein F5878DRAFT_206520 [Lentinula raphanica]|uniref:Uncharacterized protein n=1 Tax=Lentinula raphanica TaxID=153919 RepID=A0AA38PMF8_9AGAR|nr:hypothetical protein F5878DRAFT_206520 [Lentinula raphanica]